MAFYELRRYTIRPGKMKEWVAFMEGTIIPFQVSKGMVITGSYRGEEDDSIYFWTRRFENEQSRKTLYAAVYESDFWKNEVAPKVADLIDRDLIQVTRVVPTPHSVAQ
ncbi:MAG: NIPSNAP family protein [Alphaproteobacteria bacterium]|nr:NIPSNAP family protein [Alphaproteobacteria bacterium]MCY4319339.1 NIPSNAP family protein [Alphaproteobacteria bacterium]